MSFIGVNQTGMTLPLWHLLSSRVSPEGGFLSCSPASDWLLFPQKREAFCQLLQLMKNKHSKQDEPDMISVFIGTWNMGEAWGRGLRCEGSMASSRGLTAPHPLRLQEVCLLRKM